MSELFQVWANPGVNLVEPIRPRPDVMLKAVTIEAPGRPPFVSTLLQMESNRPSNDASHDAQFRILGKILTRLSFALLCQFTVFSARIVPSGLKRGDKHSDWAYPGSPPGIALSEVKIGFNKTLELSPDFLVEDVRPEVESAIGWFLAGNNAPNAIQQVLCHWIGLESLAPVVEGPWRCSRCEAELATCPSCGGPTTGPKTVQTVRAFLRNELAVSRSEYESLYSLRCRVAHGGLPLDPEGLQAASNRAARIQELLLIAIKRALGWPPDRPPIIDPQGLTILGVPGLKLSGEVPSDDFYDKPAFDPA